MIIEKYTMTDLAEVADLNDTARGAGGFGSTGVERLQKGTVEELEAAKKQA